MTSEPGRLEYLAALGIDVFTPRTAPFEPTGTAPPIEESHESPAARATTDGGASRQAGAPTESLGWPELEARVAACTLCPLHQGRTRTVFGVGNRTADWMIVGEAPGATEQFSPAFVPRFTPPPHMADSDSDPHSSTMRT